MVDLNKLNEALNTHIRPPSFPLAVRLCTADETLPEKTYYPKKNLGISIVACQAWAMARRYGWTVAVSRDDQACPHGHAVLGFIRPKGYLDGTVAEKTGLWTKEEFARMADSLTLLDYGRYSHLLVAPLDRATFEPHFALIYGNPAQVARMVQGATQISGKPLMTRAGGGIACSTLVARTMLADECQVVLAGAGDRYFALTQDHELAFTIPISKFETTIEGLALGSKKLGHRYPTPSFLRFEAPIPSAYQEFTKLLFQEE